MGGKITKTFLIVEKKQYTRFLYVDGIVYISIQINAFR